MRTLIAQSVARVTGLEPATSGFGGRRTSSCASPTRFGVVVHPFDLPGHRARGPLHASRLLERAPCKVALLESLHGCAPSARLDLIRGPCLGRGIHEIGSLTQNAGSIEREHGEVPFASRLQVHHWS